MNNIYTWIVAVLVAATVFFVGMRAGEFDFGGGKPSINSVLNQKDADSNRKNAGAGDEVGALQQSESESGKEKKVITGVIPPEFAKFEAEYRRLEAEFEAALKKISKDSSPEAVIADADKLIADTDKMLESIKVKVPVQTDLDLDELEKRLADINKQLDNIKNSQGR